MFTEDAIIFVDADSLFFRIACVTKNRKEIRKAINHSVKEIRRECMSDKILFAVKGEGNFRKDLYPEYKANRKELDKDLKDALNYGHKYMCDYHGAHQSDGMEADDVVSIWAHEAMAVGQDYYIAGIDKDLLQIPGNHYNFVKRTHTHMDHDAAHRHLMLQCLTGDTADNIPGIKGVGPKKALRILDGVRPDRMWSRVRAAWRMHGAGDPTNSWRLLAMLKSWEELDGIKDQLESKTSVSERNVLEEGKANEEDDNLSGVSARDTGRVDRSQVAVRR